MENTNLSKTKSVKRALMAIVGWAGIVLCGLILAVLMSIVPVGFSDAEAATIGRMIYRGLPWPYYVADGVGMMHGFGMWLERFPVNAVFWTVVTAFLSCIPNREVRWGRVFGITLVALAIYGSFATYLFWL